MNVGQAQIDLDFRNGRFFFWDEISFPSWNIDTNAHKKSVV
jgi:hypothetical protein